MRRYIIRAGDIERVGRLLDKHETWDVHRRHLIYRNTALHDAERRRTAMIDAMRPGWTIRGDRFGDGSPCLIADLET